MHQQENGRLRSQMHVKALETQCTPCPTLALVFSTQVLSPFVYHATKKVLADSFKDPSKPLPTRMREKPNLYQASLYQTVTGLTDLLLYVSQCIRAVMIYRALLYFTSMPQ